MGSLKSSQPLFPFHESIIKTMLLLRLQHIGPLLDATSILDQCSNKADVRISPAKLSIITSSSSRRFFATLEMSPESFVNYSVDRNQSLMMFIPAFRNAMIAGRTCPFVKIHLLQDSRQIILTFETPSLYHIFHYYIPFSFNSFMSVFDC